MTTEMLWTKEDLHEVDWVKEQTKSALSGLQKEVLYTKNGDEVKFDVDTSLNYLKTLKDKKSYSEVMKDNPWATVMAVQILLKNKWYNIGKIDGILKTQWKSTSKTMEAIAKFQSENWLTPDGAPGPDTIKKLLEIYGNWWWKTWWNEQVKEDEKVKDLTEKEYEALREKTSLTDDEVKQVVEYANKYDEMLLFTWLTSITDKQAEELWKINWVLSIKWLRSITDKQAVELWKVKEALRLNWLRRITDKQAEELSKVEYLELGWLTSITDKQAEEFWKVNSLWLDWLTSITDKQAEELWKVKESLTLNWLRRITDKQAEELSKVEYLQLGWLTSITDKQAEGLRKVKWRLVLDWLTSITDKQAAELAKVEWISINKDILTPKQKQILKKHI